MNPFGAISESYKRWRHSHGFGVHSPFAYDLVKNALSPGSSYSYYGYVDIDREMLKPGAAVGAHTRHDAYLLLRLLVFLRVKQVLIYPGNQPVLSRAVKAAGVKCRELTKGSLSTTDHDTLIVITRDVPFYEGIVEAVSKGASVMALDPAETLRESLAGVMTNGLTLDGKRILIAIPRSEMVLTYYTMKF